MSVALQVDWQSPLGLTATQSPNPTGRLRVEFEGRIDNLADVRAALGLESDSTINDALRAGYRTWGGSLPDRLAGDFAFAIWDGHSRSMLAARDPFGVRPLFYRSHGSRLWLASRIETLLDTFDTLPAFDDARVVEHLLATFSATDATFFRDIRQVPPGHALLASAAGVEIRRYWSPALVAHQTSASSAAECREELKRLFVQSVRRRLGSASGVMIHVSGGLDSSAIACAADGVMRTESAMPPVVGVTAQYPTLDCDESAFVDAVARRIGFPIERWVDVHDGGMADLTEPRISEPGIRATFGGGTAGDLVLARRHGASVILSGLGGDQFGMVDGYVRDLLASHQWGAALRELFFFPDANTRTRIRRVRHVLRQVAPHLLGRASTRSTVELPGWLAGDLWDMATDLMQPETAPEGPASQLSKNLWKRLMSGETLRNVSILNAEATFHEVEYRFPYLDKDLVRFALSIPLRGWPRPGIYARLHREALAEMLPSEIATRDGKAEFTPAVVASVRRAEGQVRSLFQGDWASERYVDKRMAEDFWGRMMTSGNMRARDWRQVWAIATLEAWIRGVLGYYQQTKEARRAERYLGSGFRRGASAGSS